MPHRLLLTVWTLASIILSTAVLGAQTPLGTLRGTVVDRATQAPLGGATIRLVGSNAAALSDEFGSFVLPQVPPGVHSLEAQRIGYRPSILADLVVHPGRTSQTLFELDAVAVQLEEVRVVGSYFRHSEREPVGSLTFSAEEVRRAPGITTDVSRTLAAMPAFAQLGDSRNDLLVRGGSSMENGFFIDNIPIPNINHFPTEAHTGGPIGMLNISFIREVQASVGGFSALHGDRLSSIVDIRYREGNREEVDGEAQVSMAGFSVALEGPLAGSRGSWMLSGSRSYLDLLVSAIGTSGVAPRYGDVQGKVVYDLNRRHAVTGLGIVGSSGISFDRVNVVESEDLEFYGRSAALQWTAGVNWGALWSERSHSNTSLSLSRIGADETWHDRLDDRLEMRSDNADLSASVRSVTSWAPLPGHTLDVGLEATVHRARYDYLFPATIDRPIERQRGDLAVRDAIEAAVAAGFASLTLPLAPQLTGTFGLRGEYSHLNGESVVLPRLAVSYRATPRLRLNGAGGLYAQTLPLFLLSQHPDNRELPHASAAHYILGAEYLITPAFQVSFEAYRKDYLRLPLNPREPERFPVDDGMSGFGLAQGPLVEGGRALAQGIELVAQRKRVERFHALASAALFRSRYRDLNGTWRDRLYDNRLILQLLAGYQPTGSKWDFSGRWIYGGGVPYTPVDTERSREVGRTFFDVARTNAERLPPYHSLHLRTERRHHFRHSSLVWSISLTNAYGRRNVRTYQWNRRTGEVEPIHNFGFLPVLGVEYRF